MPLFQVPLPEVSQFDNRLYPSGHRFNLEPPADLEPDRNWRENSCSTTIRISENGRVMHIPGTFELPLPAPQVLPSYRCQTPYTGPDRIGRTLPHTSQIYPKDS